MTADSFGNDVSAVAVPVTGHIGLAPLGTAIPTSSAGKSTTLTLDPAFKIPGLFSEDGGFEWTLESDGDPIPFFQEGYSLPTGLAKAELVVKLAQTDEIVRSIIRGKTADSNGYMTIDAGGTAVQYVIFTEEIFKNGDIRRRVAAVASIKSVKEAKSEKGKVVSYEVTFKIERSPLLENNHIGEWLIKAGSAPAVVPTISAATPSAAAAGATVTITGTGFTSVTGASSVKFGATNATSYTVVSDTSITAVMPAGSAGSAAIVVTNAVGASTAFAYTRGA